MQTRWAKKIDVKNCFSEYPRMHMQRDSYTCLNGIWQYEITSKDGQPGSNYQNILVPFPVGSPLSKAPEVLKDDEVLWYRKRFSYQRTNERTILHFEAVDQKCVVYLNNVEELSNSLNLSGSSMLIALACFVFAILIVGIVDNVSLEFSSVADTGFGTTIGDRMGSAAGHSLATIGQASASLVTSTGKKLFKSSTTEG